MLKFGPHNLGSIAPVLASLKLGQIKEQQV